VSEPQPIWLAALLASSCLATGKNGVRNVDWQWVSGRAIYTNDGTYTEVIQPFGFPVRSGQSLVVTWLPNDTAYRFELYDYSAQEPECSDSSRVPRLV
jgi:hypothetical protein